MKEYFDYLDELRLSGETNMYGAAPCLQATFGIDIGEARNILQKWMNNFGNN